MFSRTQTTRIPRTTQNSQSAGSERLSYVSARRANPTPNPVPRTPTSTPTQASRSAPYNPVERHPLDADDPVPPDHNGNGPEGDAGPDPGGDPDQGPGGDPPGGPGGPDDGPDEPEDIPEDDDDETPNLAAALALLAKSLQKPRSENTKVREPDSFDGSDPKKLRSFIVQCQMNFNNCPNTFSSERAKVNYALSYLKGIALEWFEPTLFRIQSDDIFHPPLWYSEYSAFISELQSNFGPHDPVGDAEAELEALEMRDNQRISKYLVEFNKLSSLVEWNSAALRRRFYKGLPTRIKNEIARVGKPDTLQGLRTLAQSIDARYWEYKSEQNRESSSKPVHQEKKTPVPQTSQQHSHNTPSSSKPPNTASSSSNVPKPPAKPATSPLTDKLGKDGKLTQEEQQCRFDNRLCLFCGGPSHTLPSPSVQPLHGKGMQEAQLTSSQSTCC